MDFTLETVLGISEPPDLAMEACQGLGGGEILVVDCRWVAREWFLEMGHVHLRSS